MKVAWVALLLASGCGWLLGINDPAMEVDGGVSDAQTGVEIARDEFDTFEPAKWLGTRYCYNEPAGDYTPDVAGGRLLMRADDFCHATLRSTTEWQPPFRIVIDFTAHLASGGKNHDGLLLLLGRDWPIYGSERSAGVRIEVPPGDVLLWTQSGGSSTSIGSLATGESAQVSLELNTGGDVIVRLRAQTTRLVGALSPGAPQQLYMTVMNSADGFDVERVVVEQLVP